MERLGLQGAGGTGKAGCWGTADEVGDGGGSGLKLSTAQCKGCGRGWCMGTAGALRWVNGVKQ